MRRNASLHAHGSDVSFSPPHGQQTCSGDRGIGLGRAMEKFEKRVLVVDDDDAIRSLLVTVVRRRGFKVDSARDGEDALAHLARCTYSLMLLDLMMPRLSGPDVLARLSAMDPTLRPFVIVLTAGTEPRDLDPAIVSGTIRKPFDIEVLLETVVACLRAVEPRTQVDGCVENGASGQRSPED